MDEFVEQFLLESRELIDQATADLLAVEENPGDAERLDGAFRAFHTLKGSAGIVDFDAMAKAAHAAEDVLAAARSGQMPISRELISDCLSCLDLILQWLDAMQIGGKIPPNADGDATVIVDRFGVQRGARNSASTNVQIAKISRDSTDRLSMAAKTLLQAQLNL